MCNTVSRARVTIAQPDPAQPARPPSPAPLSFHGGDFSSWRRLRNARSDRAAGVGQVTA